jgi:hypothetical protein
MSVFISLAVCLKGTFSSIRPGTNISFPDMVGT